MTGIATVVKQSAPAQMQRHTPSIARGSNTIDLDSLDVRAAQAGDAAAFSRLVRRHGRLLNGLLRRFTVNETEIQDLMQETHIEVYRSLSTYRGLGPFASWLRQIASRVGYRFWKSQSRQVQAKAAFTELYRTGASTAPVAYRHSDAEYVKEILARFGRRDESILKMRYVQGLSPTEIARKMGWKVERVRVRLHRALKKLRRTHDPRRGG